MQINNMGGVFGLDDFQLLDFCLKLRIWETFR